MSTPLNTTVYDCTTEPIIPADKSFFKAKMVGAVGNLCYAFLAVLSFTLDTAFLRFRLAPADGERSPFLRAAGRKYEGWLFVVLCVVPRKNAQRKKEREKRHNGKLMKWSTKHEKVF